MNYHAYYPVDVVNGPGTRATLFVSGCIHHCPGCYNQSTWLLTSGIPFTSQLEDQIIYDLQDTTIPRRGLSLSGGDPLHPQNVGEILALVKRVKGECPGKDIWIWTGYRLVNLTAEQKAILPYIDVLIDGKFIKKEADARLIWRGSRNQIIHYLRPE